MQQVFNQPVTKRNLALLALAIAVFVLVFWGGSWAWQHLSGSPPTTAGVRKAVWKYLVRESHHGDFQPATDWAALTNYTAVETAAATDTTTGASESVKVKTDKMVKPLKVKPKIKKLPPIQAGFSSYFREKQKEAATYEGIYHLIGQELWVAEQMFASSNSAMQQAGILLAGEAAHYALSDAENGWLAARICEGYLWPSLDLLETAARPVTTADELLTTCESAFQANGETNSLIRNYQYVIRKIPKQADLARYRVAQLYEQTGEYAKALRAIDDIKQAPSDKARARLASMRERLKLKK